MSNAEDFIKLVKHPVKFRMFLLLKLPSAFFCGVRVKNISNDHCVVSIPYKWLTRNPFKSTYFASLSMAAEMSTGALAFCHLYKKNVSMLVVKVEAEYFKKATDKAVFVCEDGDMIKNAIENNITTGEPQTARAKSVGKNKAGEIVAEFYVTWSFKSRKK